MVPTTTVFLSVSIARSSLPELTTTKLKCKVLDPFGVTAKLPVQLAFSL